MLNFRHNQWKAGWGGAVRSWGSRTRTRTRARNRSKTDSRRQPQANCWQGRSEGSCRGWKEVVCGSHSRLSENEDENEMETQNEARRDETRLDPLALLLLLCSSAPLQPLWPRPLGDHQLDGVGVYKMKPLVHQDL
ncbi:GD13590 [Drosophila simulans]|uniref:GD13590 n=1 Tax=Drosophila simulans TaxID=7240 RepID=B4QLX1_DROSI|nr:GD13590 [Drosophila simulans]